MYKELVIYMEACYSGSMFDGILQEKWNIYVMTAANPHEPSRATYCHPQDYVNDTHMKTCLGDVFSVTWMEQIDTNDTKKISFD
jgi:legumain